MFIKLTEKEDLTNVQRLWADPDVMLYVGFPEGLQESMEHLEKEWLPWVQNFPNRQHYSVYHDGIYCGEVFYDVDELGYACMDIKLLPAARGKGIAASALSHALDQAFLMGDAEVAWVDPNPENTKALKLYERFDFVPTQRPVHLEDPGCAYVYMEINREDWQSVHGIRYKDIVLRDLIEADVDDWIRWETVQTEWMDWDGPDLEAAPFVEEEFRAECAELLKASRTGFRSFFELDGNGKHIGMVSSYATAADFRHLTWREARELGEFWFTLGLVICENDLWGKGLGTQALTAFCLHFINAGKTNLRLQTWSGNIRMVRCAEKIGFVECNRIVGNRHIRGGVYDGLTFQLDLDRFHKYLRDHS